MLYMEEDLKETTAVLLGGSRMAFVEVEFYSEYYERYLPAEFPNMLSRPTDVLRKIHNDTIWPHEIIRILDDLRTCAYRGTSAELYFIAKSEELMAHVLDMGSARVSISAMDIECIRAVVDYIDAHYYEGIRQEKLVLLASMSATKLRQLFKQVTGQRITDYILRKRSERAAALLIGTDMTIDEISAATGYLTPTGFAVSFKKQTGLSPSAYRKKMRYDCMKNPSSRSDIVFE